MDPISTDDQLPDMHGEILWWHPRTLDWRLGYFWVQSGPCAPGFFKADGAWYVHDGPTWWMPVPPDPRTPQGGKDVFHPVDVAILGGDPSL